MRYTLRGAGLIDVEAGVLRDHALLVDGERIAAVGPIATLPPDVPQVDLGEAVLVPGFIDAHTHVTIRPWEGNQHAQLARPAVWQTVRGVANLRRMLQSGVTTARIMTEAHDIDFTFRDAIAQGEVEGPRLRVAGAGLSPPGRHGGAVSGVAGPDALRSAVRERISKGADHIKVFTTGGVSSTDTSLEESNYSVDELRAIVDEASSAGLRVAAHAHGGAGVDLAVEAGITSIEHGALLSEENLTRMHEAGTWLVLTNTILFHPTGIEQGDGAEPAILAKVQQARASMARVATAVREAGIPVAVGTDSMHGLFAYELEWMVAHGWAPAEALRAATSGGARLLGIESDSGRLAPGMRADVVALARDPLSDITAAADVVAVYKAGTQYRGACSTPRAASATA